MGVTYSGQSRYYEQSKKDTVKVNGKTMSVYDAVCQIVAYEAGKTYSLKAIANKERAYYSVSISADGLPYNLDILLP